MRHAIRALFVSAGTVAIPVRSLHQLREAAGVAFAKQITGLLPAEDVPRRHSPRGAVIGLVAREKVEEQAGVDQGPILTLAAAEDIAEQLFGFAPAEKMLLVGSALVSVPRRDRDSDAQLLGEIEECRDVCWRMSIINRGVHIDRKALRLGSLDSGHGAIEDAFLAD